MIKGIYKSMKNVGTGQEEDLKKFLKNHGFSRKININDLEEKLGKGTIVSEGGIKKYIVPNENGTKTHYSLLGDDENPDVLYDLTERREDEKI